MKPENKPQQATVGPSTSDPQYDPVTRPLHYQSESGIECIDAIQAALTPEEFRGYCKGNVMKYLWRSHRKGAKTQDEKKAQWYLNRMVENEAKENEHD